MGIFNFAKNENKSNRIERILSDLKVNPHDYNHEDFEQIETTLDDDLEGIIKVSENTYDLGTVPFDYIRLSEKDNGKRNLYLSMSNRDEREIKNLIDLFFSKLGEDFIYKKNFETSDLQTFRNETKEQFRNWYLGNYDVVIGFGKIKDSTITYVIVNQK